MNMSMIGKFQFLPTLLAPLVFLQLLTHEKDPSNFVMSTRIHQLLLLAPGELEFRDYLSTLEELHAQSCYEFEIIWCFYIRARHFLQKLNIDIFANIEIGHKN